MPAGLLQRSDSARGGGGPQRVAKQAAKGSGSINRKIAEMAANPRQSRGFAFDSFGKTRSCPGIATR
jgi:hypothetical protein